MAPIVIHVDKNAQSGSIVADYGIELESGQLVMLPSCHPAELGAVLDEKHGWIIWEP